MSFSFSTSLRTTSSLTSLALTGTAPLGGTVSYAPVQPILATLNQTLNGTEFNDFLQGSWGNDTLTGGAGNDWLDGGEGRDTVSYAAGGPVEVHLPEGYPDTPGPLGGIWIPGTPAPTPDGHAYDGFGGMDRLVSIENVIGSQYGDVIFGSRFDNTLRGGGAHDRISSGEGRDTLLGESGNDSLAGGDGADLIDGSLGNDLLADHYQMPWYRPLGSAGDFLAADADTLLGGVGADTLISSGGGDVLSGGDQADLLVMNFASQGAAVGFTVVAGAPWTVQLGGVVTATVDTVETLNIEGGTGNDAMNATRAAGKATLLGGAGHDTMTGGAQADILGGGAGNDVLRGGAGADRLEGGRGVDVLNGGAAADIFIWASAAEGGDRVQDFVSGLDLLQVDASGFGGGLVAGALAPGLLVFGNAATAAIGQFVYKQAGGQLLWDADGAGGAAAQHIATFTAGTTLAASDFLVVA